MRNPLKVLMPRDFTLCSFLRSGPGCQTIWGLISTLATGAEPGDSRELPGSLPQLHHWAWGGSSRCQAQTLCSACQGPGGVSQLAQSVHNPQVCGQLAAWNTLESRVGTEGISQEGAVVWPEPCQFCILKQCLIQPVPSLGEWGTMAHLGRRPKN